MYGSFLPLWQTKKGSWSEQTHLQILWQRSTCKGKHTTNLFQHLREHHPSEYAEIASKSTTTAQRGESSKTMQPTILDTLSNSIKYGSDSAQAKQLNKAVTYFIAKDAMPLYTVEKPGFWYLISKLNPRYSLPSRPLVRMGKLWIP